MSAESNLHGMKTFVHSSFSRLESVDVTNNKCAKLFFQFFPKVSKVRKNLWNLGWNKSFIQNIIFSWKKSIFYEDTKWKKFTYRSTVSGIPDLAKFDFIQV